MLGGVGELLLVFPPCVFGGGFYLADIWATFYSCFLPATGQDESEIQNTEKKKFKIKGGAGKTPTPLVNHRSAACAGAARGSRGGWGQHGLPECCLGHILRVFGVLASPPQSGAGLHPPPTSLWHARH